MPCSLRSRRAALAMNGARAIDFVFVAGAPKHDAVFQYRRAIERVLDPVVVFRPSPGVNGCPQPHSAVPCSALIGRALDRHRELAPRHRAAPSFGGRRSSTSIPSASESRPAPSSCEEVEPVPVHRIECDGSRHTRTAPEGFRSAARSARDDQFLVERLGVRHVPVASTTVRSTPRNELDLGVASASPRRDELEC